MAKFIYTIDGREGLIQADNGGQAFDLIRKEYGVLPDTLTLIDEDEKTIGSSAPAPPPKPKYNTGIAKAMETLICATILKDFTPATADQYTRDSLARDAERVWLKLTNVFDEYTEELMAAYDGVIKRINNIIKE